MEEVTECPVPNNLRQVFEQCRASCVFLGLQFNRFCDPFYSGIHTRSKTVQKLHPKNPHYRTDFACWFVARIAVENAWPWNILWSDEAHFILNGSVNTQNCRIWGTASPNVVHEQSLHSDYVTVWCDFTANFILGPFIFEESTPQGPKRCSCMSAHYFKLLQQKVIPTLQERKCLETIDFMHDGATPHIGQLMKALPRAHFGD